MVMEDVFIDPWLFQEARNCCCVCKIKLEYLVIQSYLIGLEYLKEYTQKPARVSKWLFRANQRYKRHIHKKHTWTWHQTEKKTQMSESHPKMPVHAQFATVLRGLWSHAVMRQRSQLGRCEKECSQAKSGANKKQKAANFKLHATFTRKSVLQMRAMMPNCLFKKIKRLFFKELTHWEQKKNCILTCQIYNMNMKAVSLHTVSQT